MSRSVKDKAEILQQVEELLNIKEELTKQVCVLLFIILSIKNGICTGGASLEYSVIGGHLHCVMNKDICVSFSFLCSGDGIARVIRTGEVKGEGVTVRATKTSSKYCFNLCVIGTFLVHSILQYKKNFIYFSPFDSLAFLITCLY